MFPPFVSRLFCFHLKIKKDNSLYVKLEISILITENIGLIYEDERMI